MGKVKTFLAVLGAGLVLWLWKHNSPETWSAFWGTVLGAF